MGKPARNDLPKAVTPFGAGRTLALLVVLAGARASAFDSSTLEFQRTLENVTEPGLYHVEVDPTLYRHARGAELADVRIVGPDEREVPWLLRRVPAPQQRQPRAATLLDATELPDKAARAVLDLGATGAAHSEVQLAVDADGDWVRRARVEASRDAGSWTPLVEGGYLFSISAAGVVGAQTTLVYPTSDARYLRVTLLPQASGPPLRIRGASVAFVPPEAHVPLRLLPTVKPQPVATPPQAKTSEWIIDLGAAGVPLAEVALDLGDAAFERRALLAAADRDGPWAPVAATLLYRVAPAAAGKLAEENVRLPGHRTRERSLRLTIYDGDAAPLALRAVSPAYVAEELLFRAPAPGMYTLFVGGALPAPTYDLAAVLQRSGEQPKLVASFGTITPNRAFGHLAEPAPPPRRSERYKRPIAVGAALLLAALALVAARRVRRAHPRHGRK